jgi:SPP1 gp7 family putative phage head morphogenesis protein
MCANAAHSLIDNQANDPTRTIPLRAQWMADATRRLRELQRDIRVVVGDWDVFGLDGEPGPSGGLALQGDVNIAPRQDVAVLAGNLEWTRGGTGTGGSDADQQGRKTQDDAQARLVTNAPPDPVRFMFTRDRAGTADEFFRWLRQAEREGILELVPGPGLGGEEPWTNLYVRSSYQKGLTSARAQLAAKGLDVPTGTIPGGVVGIDPVAAAFQTPFHAERIALIYQRVFTELEGVTATMNGQIRRVLARGIAEGIGADEMARRMADRVDKIGITRAKLIARTETVETYNQAAVNEFARAEQVIGEPVLVRWFTSLDERVRSSHRRRHAKVFTQAGGRSLLGEPNCRCALLPYIESVDGPATVHNPASFSRGF